jgi:hypothetical protein
MEITGNIGHDTTFIGSTRIAKICNFQQLLVPLYEKRYISLSRVSEKTDRNSERLSSNVER